MGDVSEPAAQAKRRRLKEIGAATAWKPGQSGNPSGNPSWRQKFEAEFHKRASEDAPSLVTAIIEGAKLGDEKMLRILVDKMVRKPEHVDDLTGETRPNRLEVVFVKPQDVEE